MDKKEVAQSIFEMLEEVDCEECPLKKACDSIENNDMDSICNILDMESN